MKGKNIMNDDKKRFTELLILIAICCLPLTIITGCGLAKSFSCQMCGSPNTYTPIYSSGENKEKTGKYDRTVVYQSCLGPAGCVGFGFNTSCLPTECEYVEITGDSVTGVATEDKYNMSGTVCYYNSFGCIKPSTIKSVGVYHKTTDCGGLSIMPVCGGVYKEETYGDTVKAYNADNNCGTCTNNNKPTDSLDINANLPIQFPYGCTSSCHDEDKTDKDK